MSFFLFTIAIRGVQEYYPKTQSKRIKKNLHSVNVEISVETIINDFNWRKDDDGREKYSFFLTRDKNTY